MEDFLERELIMGLTTGQLIRMVAGTALIGGIVLTLFAIYDYHNQRDFVSNAIETEGVMIGYAFHEATSKDSYDTYAPVIHFTDNQGNEHRFTSKATSYNPEYEVGQEFPLIYDPQNPEIAEINNTATIYLNTILFGGIGITFFFLGSMFLFVVRRKPKIVGRG